MRHVSFAEFEDKLTEMIAAAEAGEEIVVTRNGVGVVKLCPPIDHGVAECIGSEPDIVARFVN